MKLSGCMRREVVQRAFVLYIKPKSVSLTVIHHERVTMITRRVFIEQGGAAMATVALASRISVADEPKRVSSDGEKPWLRKSLKCGMIRRRTRRSYERFEIALQAGFEGIEPNTGTFDPDEAKAAAKQRD